MARTTFEATSVTLFGGAGEYERAVPGFSYRVRLARGESIELTTGEKFAELEGLFAVYLDTEPAAPIKEDAVGVIGYHEKLSSWDEVVPSSYSLQVGVSRPTFDELLFAARYGRIPERLSVDVDGMEYGSAPDGSTKKWDNKASSHLKISSFSFVLPLIVRYPPMTSCRAFHPRKGCQPRGDSSTNCYGASIK
jgi:hypothetical protein